MHDSWHKYPTKGATKAGFKAAKASGGITYANNLDAARGAIVLTLTFFF